MTSRDPEQCNIITTTHVNPKRLSEFKLHERISATSNFVEALEGTSMIVHCIPAQHTFDFLRKHKDIIPIDVPLVSTAKGIYVSIHVSISLYL
jgi:glycerol-3-phosphate dehydrogenase